MPGASRRDSLEKLAKAFDLTLARDGRFAVAQLVG
jgi:hypothetical protein